MAFRVRVLHSLLLGLAGFSLVLCSFFYATPVTLRYGEPSTALAAAVTATSSEQAASVLALATSEVVAEDAVGPSIASGKRILQESGILSNLSDIVQKKEKTSVGNVIPQAAENKGTTDNAVKESAPSGGSAAGASSGVGSSLQPVEELSQPVAPVSTSAVAEGAAAAAVKAAPPAAKVAAAPKAEASIIKAVPSNASRQSVIQHIAPKVSNGNINTKPDAKNTGSDDTTLGIVTSTLYESGHDIANPDFCPDFGSFLKVLILITSAPNHAEARNAIRQTWGHFNHRRDVAIAFFIGGTTDSILQNELYTESELYGDLIQSHFKDSYNNLTLKTISMLEWVDIYCHKVSYILKTDDDMFINVPKLLDFIGRHAYDKRVIFGRLAKKWKPIRNKKSKYYVSKEQYKNVLFPDFTTGPAYLITGDVVHDLYSCALNQTYLKLEDVYTTGIVAQEMKVKRVHVNEFLNKKVVGHACNVQKAISIHMVKFHEQFDLWKKLFDGKTKCK